MSYQPHLADTAFLLFDVLQAPQQLAALNDLTEADQPLIEQVLEEASKFVAAVVAPLSRQGDEIGCHWEAGMVATPPGFRAAYQAFVSAGYVREWGIEQIVRDARVSMIYEGTNEIQAIDLLLRKVLPDGGQALGALLVGLRPALDASRDFDAEVLRRLAELRYLTTTLCAACAADGANPTLPYAVADDYLRAVALVLLAWAWAQIAAKSADDDLRWHAPAVAFRTRVLPELDMRLTIIRQQMAAER